MSLSIEKFTSSFEVDFGYTVYLIDATNSSITVSLPDVSGNSAYNGSHFYVKRIDTNNTKTVLIDPYSSQTIDGVSASHSMALHASVHLVCWEGAWLILSQV